jgi:hypothetical protein
MIVLCIPDRYYTLTRNPQLRQHGGKACALVDPARQDHHRFFVKDYLQAEVQLLDRLKDGCSMRFHRRHNTLSHGKRYPLPPQTGHDSGGGGRAQKSLLAGRRVMKQSAVLGDNPVKEMEARKYITQAGEFATGDQYQLSSGTSSPFEASQSIAADPPITSQSPIIVRGYRSKSHRFSRSYHNKRRSRGHNRNRLTPG